MYGIIKGAVNYSLGEVTRPDGRIKFPVNAFLSSQKICGIEVNNSIETIADSTGFVNKINGSNNDVFINLFDIKGRQFFTMVPAYFLYYQIYGYPKIFSPRYLDVSKCFLQIFNQNSPANGSINLTLYFS